MRKLYLILCFFIIGMGVQGQKVSALFNYALFSAPNGDSYIETYLSVQGGSLKFEKNQNELYQAGVGVQVLFKDQSDQSIKSFLKYNLHSPEVKSLEESGLVMLDEQRKVLVPGDYIMDIEIFDLNDSLAKRVTASSPIHVSDYKKQIQFSGIQLVEDFKPVVEGSLMNKRGLNMPPRLNRFFANEDSLVNYYFEIYNLKKIIGEGKPLVLKMYITTASGVFPPAQIGFTKRIKAEELNVFAKSISVGELETGNYIMKFELLDPKGEVLAKQQAAFQRFKVIETKNAMAIAPGQNLENIEWAELLLYVKSLSPVAELLELPFVDKNCEYASKENLAKFLWTFWERRDAADPVGAWQKYYELVNSAEKLFGQPHLRGFQTSRGYVYCKYGVPSKRNTSEDDFLASPYEIWYYEHSKHQNNLKFVFSSTDVLLNYALIHSTASGELNNSSWVKEIYSDAVNMEKVYSHSEDLSRSALEEERSGLGNGQYKALEVYNNPY